MTATENARSARVDSPVSNTKTPPPQGAFRSLIPEVQRALAAAGYLTPTPIQEQCIPRVLEGRDVLGIAQTGTGKTAAFALPLLQRLSAAPRRPQKGSPRALILAPTRELAAQIGESIQTYGRFLRVSHVTIFGGVNQFRQVKALNQGVDIVVATPGRLLDLMQQGYVRLGGVEAFVLDEVDRMLDMGFLPDIKRVLATLPAKRQTLFFSATMAPAIAQLAGSLVRDPARVSIAPDQPAVERIAQKVLFVGKQNKDALLVSLLAGPEAGKALVFTQMKHAADRVVRKLQAAGIHGISIHGNKSQGARTKALDGFKRGQFQVLVATDLAARGLDVDGIACVINYDMPVEAETYVHRIGRTARAGADGDAISFCSADERAYLRSIERLLGKPVDADLDHAYHCETASRSTAAAPQNLGRGGGRRGNQGGRPARPRTRGAGFQSRRFSRGAR